MFVNLWVIKKMGVKFKTHSAVILWNCLFLLIFSLISFVNHYNYRTYSLDLGLYTRILYDYAHFHLSYGEVFREIPENVLSDHFDLMLMFLSPLWWIFGNLTLLVAQLLFIVSGSLGIYKLGLWMNAEKRTAIIAGVLFLAFFGLWSAVSYDFHSNVAASCLLPWMIYFFKRQKIGALLVFFILILSSKENMSLWMSFVFTGLCWMERKNHYRRRLAVILAFSSLLYFFLMVHFIMPGISTSGKYAHLEYSALGGDFPTMLKYISLHPIESAKLLFVNHSGKSANDWIKVETWVFWLLSGGFLILRKIEFIWMVIPIMAQKMFHDDPTKWSVAQQYNIELAPLAAWCLLETVSGKSRRFQVQLSAISLAMTIVVTVRLCDHTIGFVDKTRIRFYQEDHYRSDFDKIGLKRAMRLIPDSATVSAESMFVPHLIDKKAVFAYPIVNNADFILLSDDIHTFPLSRTEMALSINDLKKSSHYATVYVKNGVYLFGKVKN